MKKYAISVCACLIHGLALGGEYGITRLDARTVAFDGLITSESSAALRAEMKRGVSTLIVTSVGGAAHAGMEIGSAIRQRGITVVVDGYCLSSCANYLFLAAERKVLMNDSFLGFHGSLSGAIPAGGRGKAAYAPANSAQIDVVLDSLLRAELDFIDKAKFSGGLFRRVQREMASALSELKRPRSPEVSGVYEIRTASEVKRFKIGEETKVDAEIAMLQSQGIEFSAKGDFSVITGGDVSDIAYFPSEKTLKSYGVRGIVRYPYPQSAGALKAIVDRRIGAASIRGEFNAQHENADALAGTPQ